METPENLWTICSSALLSLTLWSIPMFKLFPLVPLPLVRSLDLLGRVRLFFTPPFQAFTQVGKITQAFSSPGKRDNPSSPNVSLSVRYCNHLITFVTLKWILVHTLVCLFLYWTGEPKTGPSIWVAFHKDWAEWENPLPQLAGNGLSKCRPGDCWASLLQGHLVVIVLCKTALQLVSPPVCTGERGYSPQCSTLHFAELWETLVCPFLQPAEVPLNGLLRVWSVPSPGLLLKTCKSMDPIMGPGVHW